MNVCVYVCVKDAYASALNYAGPHTSYIRRRRHRLPRIHTHTLSIYYGLIRRLNQV